MTETTKLGLAPFDSVAGGVYFNMPTLVVGRRGGGKTILAAHFADKVLRTGERVLFFCESRPETVILDARSAGFDFETPAASGQLSLVPVRTAFGAGGDGVFPLRAALAEVREMASRSSASFAVFSSVVPWLASGPASGMEARVDSFLGALSDASLTSMLLVHKPASPAAEALVAKLREESPVALEAVSFGGVRRELRLLKFHGREDLKLPLAIPLELVPGKGLAAPSATKPSAPRGDKPPVSVPKASGGVGPRAGGEPRRRATLFSSVIAQAPTSPAPQPVRQAPRLQSAMTSPQSQTVSPGATGGQGRRRTMFFPAQTGSGANNGGSAASAITTEPARRGRIRFSAVVGR